MKKGTFTTHDALRALYQGYCESGGLDGGVDTTTRMCPVRASVFSKTRKGVSPQRVFLRQA